MYALIEHFLPRDVMLARYMLSSCVCPSVCPSVYCLSWYCIETTGRIELVFWHGFLPPIRHCVPREFGYLQKLAYFTRGICPKLLTWNILPRKSIALSTDLVVVVVVVDGRAC